MTSPIGTIEHDAVSEILNIAIGQAAQSLSRLIGDEVTLSVPFIDFLSPGQSADRLESATGRFECVAVRQQFRSSFSGEILLIFPEDKSLDLVRSLLSDTVPFEQLTDLEQEALLEVGNIILNACLGSLANQLGIAIESSLPSYVRGRGSRILDSSCVATELVMFLQVDFALARKGGRGFLAFVMDIAAATNFSDAVTAYVRRMIGR
jgi:chemotaxis protein CheC